MDDASIKWPLLVTYSLFESNVYMLRLTTPKFVSFDVSKFKGVLIMTSASIGGDLFMRKAEFNYVGLREAKIGGKLMIIGSTFKDGLDMTDSIFESKLDMRRSTFKGRLDMSSASVGGDLFMRNAEFRGSVYLRERAKIGGALDMSRSTFKAKLDMSSASIGGDLFMRNANFDKPAKLAFLSVGSSLDVRDATMTGLDLTGSRIERYLLLGRFRDSKIEWKDYKDKNGDSHNPKLTLRDASVGVLQDTIGAWPSKLKKSSDGILLCTEVGSLKCIQNIQDIWLDTLELDGFTYKGFGASEKETSYQRGSSWFIEWLGKDTTYSPQPYRHLAGVLRTAGFDNMANDILFASRERERGELKMSQFKWWRLSTLWIIYGYSYDWRNLLTLIWAMILVGIGTAVLRIANEVGADDKKLGFWSSLDMLLPIIQLREQHYTDVDLQTRAKYYFYVHKIMGYVLTFFMLTGLSGLTE